MLQYKNPGKRTRGTGISFCFLEAPNIEALEKHHEKYGIKRTWITEVQTTATLM